MKAVFCLFLALFASSCTHFTLSPEKISKAKYFVQVVLDRQTQDVVAAILVNVISTGEDTYRQESNIENVLDLEKVEKTGYGKISWIFAFNNTGHYKIRVEKDVSLEKWTFINVYFQEYHVMLVEDITTVYETKAEKVTDSIYIVYK